MVCRNELMLELVGEFSFISLSCRDKIAWVVSGSIFIQFQQMKDIKIYCYCHYTLFSCSWVNHQKLYPTITKTIQSCKTRQRNLRVLSFEQCVATMRKIPLTCIHIVGL